MEIIDQAFEINAPDVVGEILDGEAIILHLKRGYFYSLEGSGALIWRGVEQMLPPAAIADALSSRFSIDIGEARDATRRLFEQLVSHELLRPAARAGEAAALSEVLKNDCRYAEPELKVFTDMQDLLLLDPIHEADEAGWPIAPRQAGG